MLTASGIIEKYISFFEKRGHARIANAPLVPQNDPTTLFTSSGMQPLVSYLLGQTHPMGKRLVNVQNCFRAQDIDEIGNNRHTTFFRMLGNWSLGDYFKKEQLPWIFVFLTKELKLDPQKLFITIFEGTDGVPKDEEAKAIWTTLFENVGLDATDRIFAYGPEKNWWSRAGVPANMPAGEPGGPDSEIFYDFGEKLRIHETSPYKNQKCHVNCDCGRFIEICNSVFMQYRKEPNGSLTLLQKPNVDFGGGLERLLAAVEQKQDVFQTSLFYPIIRIIERETKQNYKQRGREMRIVTDHFIAAMFIVSNGVAPSNKEQGYLLRRLLRRGFDNFAHLGGKDVTPVLETIVSQYGETDPVFQEKYEETKNTILEEEQKYEHTRREAKKFIEKKYTLASSDQRLASSLGSTGDELMGTKKISADDAFALYTTHGLSPTQIESLGYTFDKQKFATLMETHQKLSRKGATKKFAGGLADTQEKTVMGHTATHLLHQALRDVLGNQVHQTGSNITADRVRFDFNYDKKLTDEELQKAEQIVNEKIRENLPVHFEIMTKDEALKKGAIGLFMDTYGDKVKVYFIDDYSIEFCGGPHVDFTGKLKRFNIVKQENLGRSQKRLYATVA